MSNLTVASLTGPASQGNRIDVTSGTYVYQPGAVIQVLQTVITTPTAVSVGSGLVKVTIPDLAATITPKLTTSKVYVTVRWFGELAPQTANYNTMWGIYRNGTAVLDPSSGGGASGITMAALSYWLDNADSTPEMAMFDYLDSPSSTSAITYSVYVEATVASTLYTNRTVTAGAVSYEYGSSSITLWEIAA